MAIKSRLSCCIKQLRLEKNLSQVSFGKKIGLSGKMVSAYETGRSEPPLKILENISRVYKVPLIRLSDREDAAINKAIQDVDTSLTNLKKILDSGLSL